MKIDHTQTWQLWEHASLNSGISASASLAANKILKNRDIYEAAGSPLGIPFYVVGALHDREASFDFKTWLANGDPLFDHNGVAIVTTHVPKGLGPANSWANAAAISFAHEGWNSSYHWDIVNALENMEAYNGEGYRSKGLPSPYIWAGTINYSHGKYASDGVYDPNLVDKQLGCAAILLALKALGVDLNEVRPA